MAAPASPTRRRPDRLVLVMGIAAIAAGLFVAITLVAINGRPSPDANEPPPRVDLGPESAIRAALAETNTVYFADPRGGPGFFLTEADGSLTAIALDVPGRDACRVDYDVARRQLVDCDGADVGPAVLATHPVSVEEERVFVDTRTTTPPVSSP